MRTFRIRVSAEHISDGIKENCQYCPIALAIKEQLQDVLPEGSIRVTPGRIDLISPFAAGILTIAHLPFKAGQFIRLFDSGNEVVPFEFDIQVDEGVLCE